MIGYFAQFFTFNGIQIRAAEYPSSFSFFVVLSRPTWTRHGGSLPGQLNIGLHTAFRTEMDDGCVQWRKGKALHAEEHTTDGDENGIVV